MLTRNALRRLFGTGLALTLPLFISGCFLRLLFGAVGERDTEFGTVFVATIGGTWGPMAVCDFGGDGALVDCTYSFLDVEAVPPVIDRTSSAELISESGVLGLFVDPLIVQIPSGATNFAGSFDDGTGPRGIVITETTSFDVQPGTTVDAEAGRKFVILEFPPDVVSDLASAGSLAGPFDFNFEFEVPALSPVDIKAMYTGRIEEGGETFYAPMFPCVTDFADVPSLTLPVSQAPVDLMAQVVEVLFLNPSLGCDGVVYDYTAGGPPPALGVTIDIKPGSDPNSINCGNLDETVPVAILTGDGFDATTVDHATVEFEGATEAHVDRGSGEPRRHEEDVDGDGDLDLVLHFRLGDTGLGCASTEGRLTGETIDGEAIEGSDAVRMVGG